MRDLAGDSSEIGAMSLEHYPGMTERMLEKHRGRGPGALAPRGEPGGPPLRPPGAGRPDRSGRDCASAHREAAFEACQFLIDWLKTKAPFWKLEETDQGSRWVEARDSDDQAATRWTTPKSEAAE